MQSLETSACTSGILLGDIFWMVLAAWHGLALQNLRFRLKDGMWPQWLQGRKIPRVVVDAGLSASDFKRQSVPA